MTWAMAARQAPFMNSPKAHATLEQRIAWHVEHQQRCGRRPIPVKLSRVMAAPSGSVELNVDRGGYLVDDRTRTYRFLRRNMDSAVLAPLENDRNKRHPDGYTRLFRDGTKKTFRLRQPTVVHPKECVLDDANHARNENSPPSPGATLLDKLKGGDRRSVGRSEEVVKDVLRRPELLAVLFDGMLDQDPLVRMRAADAAEKATRHHPGWRDPTSTVFSAPSLPSTKRNYVGTSRRCCRV